MKHKHAEVLIAIAEGKEVEFYCADQWVTAAIEDSITNPLTHDHFQWRIKPEPKPDVVKYAGICLHGDSSWSLLEEVAYYVNHFPNFLKLTFDGETGLLKSAEVLK